MNLILCYSERGFTLLFPILWSIDFGGPRREVASEDWGKKLLSTSAFSLSVETRSPFLFIGGNAFFNLPFLADVPVEALLNILCIPCQVQLLSAPWPSWRHPYTTGQRPCTPPRIPVPARTACVDPSCSLVCPAGLNSAIVVSSLPCLIWQMTPVDTRKSWQIAEWMSSYSMLLNLILFPFKTSHVLHYSYTVV